MIPPYFSYILSYIRLQYAVFAVLTLVDYIDFESVDVYKRQAQHIAAFYMCDFDVQNIAEGFCFFRHLCIEVQCYVCLLYTSLPWNSTTCCRQRKFRQRRKGMRGFITCAAFRACLLYTSRCV